MVCVKLLSCGEWSHDGLFSLIADYDSVSNCIWFNTTVSALSASDPNGIATDIDTDTSSTCLAAASDCAGVAKCVTGDDTAAGCNVCVGQVDVTCPCNAGPGSCTTATARDCSLGQPQDDANSTCLVGTSGAATCGVGSCVGSAGPSCDGNTVVTCSDGIAHRSTCALDSVCVPSAAGGQCTGMGPSCSGSGFDRCDGDVLIFCVGGRELQVSCGALPIPSTCSPVDPNNPIRPAAGLPCDPTQHIDRCDGSHLVYCDGEEHDVDCGQIGFRTCVSAGALPIRGSAACST